MEYSISIVYILGIQYIALGIQYIYCIYIRNTVYILYIYIHNCHPLSTRDTFQDPQ